MALRRQAIVRRQPALRQQAQQVLVPEAAQLPARVQPGQEGEHVLVEERIARLDRGVHGHAVALGAEQQARQHDAGPEVKRAVERVPAAGALQVQAQVGVGNLLEHHFPHVRG